MNSKSSYCTADWLLSSQVLSVSDVNMSPAAISIVVEWNEEIALLFLCACLQPCAGAIPLIGCRGAAKADVRKHLTQQLTDKQLRVEKWQVCSNMLCLDEEPAFLLVWRDIAGSVFRCISILFSDVATKLRQRARYWHALRKRVRLVASWRHRTREAWECPGLCGKWENRNGPATVFVSGTTLSSDGRLANCCWIRQPRPWSQCTTEVCHFKGPVLFPGK